MRNMSFMLTGDQIESRTKTVTRRLGWLTLKPGALLCAVRKGMGLKKGEKIEKLCVIRVLDVRREPLQRMILEPEYGLEECRREGFPNGPYSKPADFIRFFKETHGINDPRCDVTRIEFEYV